jgi:hypothetical protein
VTVDKSQRRSLLAFPSAIVPLRAANWIVYHLIRVRTARSTSGMPGLFER